MHKRDAQMKKNNIYTIYINTYTYIKTNVLQTYNTHVYIHMHEQYVYTAYTYLYHIYV